LVKEIVGDLARPFIKVRGLKVGTEPLAHRSHHTSKDRAVEWHVHGTLADFSTAQA
jgi:hypothetical protein